MEDRLHLIDTRLARIEDLLEVVVRMEERQVGLIRRFDDLETMVRGSQKDILEVNKKVDRWIQRGVGLWVGLSTLAVVCWTLYSSFMHK